MYCITLSVVSPKIVLTLNTTWTKVGTTLLFSAAVIIVGVMMVWTEALVDDCWLKMVSNNGWNNQWLETATRWSNGMCGANHFNMTMAVSAFIGMGFSSILTIACVWTHLEWSGIDHMDISTSDKQQPQPHHQQQIHLGYSSKSCWRHRWHGAMATLTFQTNCNIHATFLTHSHQCYRLLHTWHHTFDVVNVALRFVSWISLQWKQHKTQTKQYYLPSVIIPPSSNA